MALAVSKALMVHEPALKPALRRGEFTSSKSFRLGLFWLGTVALLGWPGGGRPWLHLLSVR